jgi:hypothetical protein
MKNWKTTLVGAIIAVGTVVLNLYQTGTVDTKTLLIAGGFALIGFLTKDFDKTGLPKDKKEGE